MTRALVTGGAGFIGSHLVRRLLEQGVDVIVLDDLSSGDRARLDGLDVEFLQGSLLDADTVTRAAAGADWVFHLAAMIAVGESMREPLACYRTNSLGSLHVLEAARAAGAERVVLSSSCAVYGDRAGPVAEADELAPLSPYAGSKAAMEAAGSIYARVYDLPVISLRYFNVYGPGQSPRSEYAAVIPAFIQAMSAGRSVTIDGDGSQQRDFVYIDDVIEANLLAARSADDTVGTFNIGSGASVSILDLVSELQRIFPNAPAPEHGPRRQGDIHFSQADLSRAQEALGYRPQTALRQGLEATVEWFESNHTGTM